MIQLKQSDLSIIREKWYNEINGICPLLGKHYPLSDFVIDHMHKLIKEEADETGKGLCRGAIQFQANALEGKISNSFKRLGLEKHIDLISFLRNLANYLENNKIHTDEKYIHPNEAPQKPMLMKSSYNNLIKVVNGSQKVPEFKQKKGNFTKPLELLFKKYGIIPEFKK